jgi:hypothetical protein
VPREQVVADLERLLRAAGPLERAAVCCINPDDRTPNVNVRAIFETVERYRHMGAGGVARRQPPAPNARRRK